MTQDEILEIAKEVYGETVWTEASLARLQQFVNLIAAKATEEANARANASWTLMCKKMVAIEREACAKVCEDYGRAEEMQAIGNDYAAAIRASGEQA